MSLCCLFQVEMVRCLGGSVPSPFVPNFYDVCLACGIEFVLLSQSRR